MKKNIRRGIIIYGTGFILFFIFRLLYGCFAYPPGGSPVVHSEVNERGYLVRNYATSKMKYIKQDGGGQVTVDQKYERIADFVSVTAQFKEDEQLCRNVIKNYKALIQHESKSGLEGNRSLSLIIGVNPDRFDEMNTEIEKIGKIVSKNITKVDKTNEYKDLNVKKESLMKTRQSLLKLKGKGGKIDEFVKLENRILEIEEEIQQLGVRLGEFDAENEFCTINFKLLEKAVAAGIPVFQRIKVALEWTITYYLLFTATMFFGLGLVLIVIKLMEKMGLFKKFLEQMD